MRWVDIEAKLPEAHPDLAAWEARSVRILNDLREEVIAAEAEAEKTGGDALAARKNAITKGLEKKSRQNLWRELAPYLSKLRNGKCWYSESQNCGSSKDIDHFRPKNAVSEEPGHEGYWWLAFDWTNYRYSCQYCNQRRVDAANGTDGGKLDHFPLGYESFRARQEADNWKKENIDLLDPIDPDDWKLLTFRPNGQPIPSKPQGTREFDRANKSIQVYHLHYYEFVQGRKAKAITVRLLIQSMEELYPKIDDPEMKSLYKEGQKSLLRLIHPDSEYSAAALAYARAEIYKMERGHQVKRLWLEEILSLSP